MFFTNPEHSLPDIDFDDIDWDSIIPDLPKFNYSQKTFSSEGLFDRVVYTDCHIGMDISPQAQYGGKWNKEELMSNLYQMCKFIISNRKSPVLVIDDLGDFMDGWDGQTVRRHHDLPQNMNNTEAFETGLGFKIKMLTLLAGYYDKIIIHNITEDNHSGHFGRIVNLAFKKMVDNMFDNVEVINYNKFINHYTVCKNTFILCHGKDSKNLKFGFKPKLDPKGLEKINNYIDNNYLIKKGHRIEFSKGDSHVEVKDKEFPTRFEYWCYPAFSPASGWVQANYVPKDYGFYMFNYYEANRYDTKPFYFGE
jgi:hypothetical protein